MNPINDKSIKPSKQYSKMSTQDLLFLKEEFENGTPNQRRTFLPQVEKELRRRIPIISLENEERVGSTSTYTIKVLNEVNEGDFSREQILKNAPLNRSGMVHGFKRVGTGIYRITIW